MQKMEEVQKMKQRGVVNLDEFWEKTVAYWPWVIVSVLVSLLIGFYYYRSQPDLYETNSSVLVMDQSKSGQMNEMTVLNQLDAVNSNTPTPVNDEEQVLRSTVLLKRVVASLELYVTYSRKAFLRTEDLYKDAPLYANVDSLFLSRLKSPLSVHIEPEDNNRLEAVIIYDGKQTPVSVDQLPAVIVTPVGRLMLYLRGGNRMPDAPLDITIYNPVKIAERIRGSLLTEINKQTNVITMTMQTSNAQMGKDILNELVRVYNMDAIEQVNRSAINTVRFIDSRLKFLTAELSDVEHNVENYKQSNNFSDLDDEAKVYLTKSTEYEQQQVALETQLHLVRYVDSFLRNAAHKTDVIPNLGFTDVGLIAIIGKYNELIISREHLLHNSTDNNPTLRNLSLQIDAANKAILASLENVKKGLQISINDVLEQKELFFSKLHGLPRQERQFLEIERQQKVKESLYLFLLQKREEASLNTAITVPKGRVLNKPEDSSSIGIKPAFIVSVCLFLGLFIPLFVIYFSDVLRITIDDKKDLAKFTSLPIIAQLGHADSKKTLLDHRMSDNINVELFRLLRAKLQFTLGQATSKVILITSTEPREGKTMVSMNTAVSLSMVEKKVLLMGMDLRGPALSKTFNLSSQIGLSSYLNGLEDDFRSLVLHVEDYPGLDILPLGIIPANPNELLMKERLDVLMEEAKKDYDYIVLDTAPIGVVSDTFLLGRFADLTLYIIRARYSHKRNIEYVNQMASEGVLPHLYLVVNDVVIDNLNYYHRGYSYGYGKYYNNK
jgi:capsular exopolysaccharide synthesis family protein